MVSTFVICGFIAIFVLIVLSNINKPFSLDELLRIAGDRNKTEQKINLFKQSDMFKEDLKLLDRICNGGLPSAYEYNQDSPTNHLLHMYHFGIILQFILLGFNPLSKNNLGCGQLFFHFLGEMAKVETNENKSFSKDMYYGAILASYYDYSGIINSSRGNFQKFTNDIDMDKSWFFFSSLKKIWFDTYLNLIGKYMNNKGSLEACTSIRVSLSDEIFKEICSRYWEFIIACKITLNPNSIRQGREYSVNVGYIMGYELAGYELKKGPFPRDVIEQVQRFNKIMDESLSDEDYREKVKIEISKISKRTHADEENLVNYLMERRIRILNS